MYIEERHFVKTAIQNMEVLARIWTSVGLDDHSGRSDQTRISLDAIKTTSAAVQARGVYRAAVMCEDVLTRTTADNLMKMNAPLVELDRLVNLYADGLFEIDPEFAALIHEPDAPTQSESQLSNRHAKAVRTLSALMPNVKSAGLRSALQSLMQPVTVDANARSARKTMSLDTLIQPISNLVLSEARHRGKVVTVSYAADFADLSYETAQTVQDVLETACLKIVSEGIPALSKAELGTTPQISLTGQTRGNDVLFSISWMGLEINERDMSPGGFAAQMQKLQQSGGSYSMNKLALSDKLKSRHTLYIKLPMTSTAGFNVMNSQMSAKVEMGVSGHA